MTRPTRSDSALQGGDTPSLPEPVGHTLGPWFINPASDEEICAKGECLVIARVPSEKPGVYNRNGPANARLIAAAPDFAEAAPDAADLLEQYASFIRESVKADDLDMHPYLPEVERVAAALRAAINKALGQGGAV